ncbi:MAG: HTTM domain-containing protein [Ignavibacteria bacterium]|nr:HTTM domain-containing protein [Ignavibacteria bacterium]
MMGINKYFRELLFEEVRPEPLAFFRIVFGLLMTFSTIRYISNGWINKFFVQPQYYFKYPYFHWVQNPGEIGIYFLFGTLLLSSILITIGYKYRFASIAFLLSFLYIELIDITYYLNHYYFVSLIAFIMVFLPAERCFSLDASRYGETKTIPNWTILIIKFQVAIVYIFAGLAKLNYDWLIDAMPLSIWLPANSHIPIVGGLLKLKFTAYLFSWFGAIYDLFIVLFLIYPKTRKVAYFFVIVFHLSTSVLFNIGVFPYVMIALTTIYFDKSFQVNIITKLKNYINYKTKFVTTHSYRPIIKSIITTSILIFTIVQIAIPLRFMFYKGDLFWKEEGYRFSWRVMLMEKAGTVFFRVHDRDNGRNIEIVNSDYLTANQEKQMSTQPDLILQFVKIIEEDFAKKGKTNIEIYADSFVKLNGNFSRRYIDDKIDLTQISYSDDLDTWILPNN